MRIRNVKPGFYRSDDIDALTWEQRFLFIALFSYVDDNGVGRDREADICADLFAGDFSVEPGETLGRVRQCLLALVRQGLVVRYEVEGKRYLFITGWDDHQYVKNPNPVRYPRPDKALLQASVEAGEKMGRDGVDAEDSLPTVVGSRSLVVGSGLLVVGNPQPDPIKPNEFDAFWTVYPRKVGKGDAIKAYAKARRKASAESILSSVALLERAYDGQPKTFIPHPATWLNAERWTDEPLDINPARQSPISRGQAELEATIAGLDAWVAEEERKAIGQ